MTSSVTPASRASRIVATMDALSVLFAFPALFPIGPRAFEQGVPGGIALRSLGRGQLLGPEGSARPSVDGARLSVSQANLSANVCGESGRRSVSASRKGR